MNIIQRSLKRFFKEPLVPKTSETVLANGLTDKRDVEDPTGKFYGTRIITSQVNGYKLRKNVEFSKPEYDLPTIANAIQMDGILQRAVNLFTEQILKNGYDWISKNMKLQKYVNKRMKEIQNLTGIPFYELVGSISRQLVTYGNAYVIKVRSSTKSSFGKEYQLYNRDYDPIVGLFVADATTIQVGINDTGQVVNYKQNIAGNEVYWDEREVIHIAYNKIPGTLTGMSSIIPILDDVRALRKMEEEVEILGFQYSIPLYLYKVGNKDMPPAPGEIDQVKETVNNMPAYGMLVVPGHHTIEVPTNTNTPVDLLSFVNHFKSRIFAGLGVSPVAMGEGSSNNRNTSQVMDVSMQTITKRYQQLIKNRLEMDLFREIMLDGEFDINNETLEFTFPEIDLESQIKKETNIIAKFQNNMVTRSEARNELDYETKIADEDTFLRLVDIPKIEAQQALAMDVAELNAETSIKLAKSKPAPSASGGSAATGAAPALPKPGVGGHSVTKMTHKVIGPPKEKKGISNKVAPANQHGKSSGRPKYVKNSIDSLIDESLNKVHILLQDEGHESALNIITLSNKLIENAHTNIKQFVNDTISDLCNYHHIQLPEQDNIVIDNYLDNVEVVIKDKIKRLGNKLDSSIKVDIFSEELRDFLELQKEKAFNLSKLLVYKSLGFVTILVSADSCDLHSDVIVHLNDLTYANVPPFKYNCTCDISEKSLYEFNEVDSKVDTSQD